MLFRSTLLEIVISLGIFIILFTLTLGIYGYSLRAEQRTIQISRLQKEAQLIMEIMAKKIRSSKINYDYYSNNINIDGETVLALLDKGNNQTIFRLRNNTLEVCIDDCASEQSFQAIPAQNIDVTSLTFYIDPASNPFSLDAPPSSFPKITVVINLQNTTGVITRNLLIQQTVPQRLAGP